jgi:hypothetical protein
MPNLGNILPNSLFHHVKKQILKKKISQKFGFILRTIFLPNLPLDYITLHTFYTLML